MIFQLFFTFILVRFCQPQVWCWDRYSGTAGTCSGHGDCDSINHCDCDQNYSGPKCEQFSCFGTSFQSVDVCNGFGSCVDHDTCECQEGFSTTTTGCDTCSSDYCNGGGTCSVTAPHVAQCICGGGGDGRRGIEAQVPFYLSDQASKTSISTGTSTTVYADDLFFNTGKQATNIIFIDSFKYACAQGQTGKRARAAIYVGTSTNYDSITGVVYESPVFDMVCDDSIKTAPEILVAGPYQAGFYFAALWVESDVNMFFDTSAPLGFSGVIHSDDQFSTTGSFPTSTLDLPATGATQELFWGFSMLMGTPDTTLGGEQCEECQVGSFTGVHMDGYCYYTFPSVGRDWQGAREYCKQNFHPASDLAVVNDVRAQKAFMESKGTAQHSWILFSDGRDAGQWDWIDGADGAETTPAFSRWNPNFPDEGGDCAYIHMKGRWLNYHCSHVPHPVANAITCQLNMVDEFASCSSNNWLNTGYSKYDFTESWCDWESLGDACCEDQHQLCNGVKQGTVGVCSGHGDCHFDNVHKENYCQCYTGWEGNDCQYEHKEINGVNCSRWDNYCYKLFSDDLKWNQARAACKSWHPAADLAIISNEHIQRFMEDLLINTGTGVGAWIGALDFVEGTFRWVDHSPMNYQNWIVYDDGLPEGQDCLYLHPPGSPYYAGWETRNCDIFANVDYICGLLLDDEGSAYSSTDWVNVEYHNVNTGSTTCTCSAPLCPSSGCE